MRVGEERRGKGDGGWLRRVKEDVKEMRFTYVYFLVILLLSGSGLCLGSGRVSLKPALDPNPLRVLF